MTDTRTPTEAAAARRLKQQHRRVKRGIVASYIHEISERHNDGAVPEEVAAEAVLDSAEEQAA
jgi:hypothetical protein